jgi:23S rRNA pseudouridine1911/1915/1917 synthase
MIQPAFKNVNTYKIIREFSGTRLDKFLVAQFPDYSRARIQKMIKSGQVLLNDKPTAVHHFLKEGDEITLTPQAAVPAVYSKTLPHLSVGAVTRPQPPSPEIISDTPDYLIINKPAGLLVHEATSADEPTLVDWLLTKYPALKKIGEDPSRPAIVHRLDKEVSGLMVIPKTQSMFDHLKSQFKTRKIKKEYTALVYGEPEKLEGEITFNIDRGTEGHKMVAIPLSGKVDEVRGRKAITKFEIIKSFAGYTLLKAMPATGRTHQIRVHLNAYGLPIVGDPLYKSKKLKKTLSLDRIFLHATKLGFWDLSDDWKEYKTELPTELDELLATLTPQ